MGEGMQAPVFHGAALEAFLEGDEDSVSFSSDSRPDSTGSSLSDLTDDATSSSAGSPSGHPQVDACRGPLCELSSLRDQLPIKRGLSKFFSGKSQSFTSISNVRCVEDLAKKETQTPSGGSRNFIQWGHTMTPHKMISKRTKACRSSYYGGMLDLSSCRSTCFAPGPCNKTAISKRSPRGYSCASSLATSARRSSNSKGLFCSSKPAPPLPVVVHKDM